MGNVLSGAMKTAYTFSTYLSCAKLVTAFEKGVGPQTFYKYLDEIERITGVTITLKQRGDSWQALKKFARCLRGLQQTDVKAFVKALNEFNSRLVWPAGPYSTGPEVQQLRSSVARIMVWSNTTIGSIYGCFDTQICQPLDTITQSLNVGKFSRKQYLYKMYRISVFAADFCCALY